MMADFLTRLAEQALGAPPAIRPDVAPVFGPAAGIDTNLKPSLASESLTATTPQAARSLALQPLEEQQRQQMEREVHAQPELVTNRMAPAVDKKAGLLPPEPMLTPPLRSLRTREPLLKKGVDSEGIPLTPRTSKPDHVEAEEAQGPQANWKQPPQRRQSTQGAVQGSISPQTRATANAAAPRNEAANRSDSPTPTVHVTIGRVEVRAITPQPAPAQRIQEKKASRTQSLGEYLQERNRGRR